MQNRAITAIYFSLNPSVRMRRAEIISPITYAARFPIGMPMMPMPELDTKIVLTTNLTPVTTIREKSGVLTSPVASIAVFRTVITVKNKNEGARHDKSGEATIDEFCSFNVPDAALRGLAKSGSSLAARSSFNFSKTLHGNSISPRISKDFG